MTDSFVQICFSSSLYRIDDSIFDWQAVIEWHVWVQNLNFVSVILMMRHINFYVTIFKKNISWTLSDIRQQHTHMMYILYLVA